MQSEAKAKQAAEEFFRNGPVISPLSTYDAFVAGFTAALSEKKAVEVVAYPISMVGDVLVDRYGVPVPATQAPHREGEDRAEVYRNALERIANASAQGWNVETATEALNTARAIAATALAATRSGSATTASGMGDGA